MAEHDLDALCALAADLATEAGALLLEGAGRARTTVDTKSSLTDMVTEMDRAAERLILDRLAGERPDDAVLGEEGADRPGTSGVQWIIDPLDGTTNYLYGFGSFGVSVGIEIDGVAAAGAVRDPVSDETFTAVVGQGSWCNSKRLQIEGPPTLATALVGTGFSYDAERRAEQAEVLCRVLPNIRDIRRAGAAAVDLCWVGAGRLDAFFERGLAPWDWAAGSLVASEAGATTAILGPGRAGGYDSGTHIAAPPHLFDALIGLLGLAGAADTEGAESAESAEG